MRTKSIEKLLHELNQLKSQRTAVLRHLLRGHPMVVGGLTVVKRTCGKANCHCAKAPGHPVTVLMLTVEQRRRCKLVRKADVDHVTKRVNIYRSFRKGLIALKLLNETENE